jgi:hypothetical protein
MYYTSTYALFINVYDQAIQVLLSCVPPKQEIVGEPFLIMSDHQSATAWFCGHCGRIIKKDGPSKLRALAMGFKKGEFFLMPVPSSSHTTMPRAAKSLGPLADSDPELKDLNKVPARKLNNNRLTKALASSVPKPAFTRTSEHVDHSLSQPKMCIGTGSDANTGRWFQVVCVSYFPRKYESDGFYEVLNCREKVLWHHLHNQPDH